MWTFFLIWTCKFQCRALCIDLVSWFYDLPPLEFYEALLNSQFTFLLRDFTKLRVRLFFKMNDNCDVCIWKLRDGHYSAPALNLINVFWEGTVRWTTTFHLDWVVQLLQQNERINKEYTSVAKLVFWNHFWIAKISHRTPIWLKHSKTYRVKCSLVLDNFYQKIPLQD